MAVIAADARLARAQLLTPGSEVALYSRAHQRYLRVDATGAVSGSESTHAAATPFPIGSSEARFLVVGAGAGRVALYNQAHGRYLELHDTCRTSPLSVPTRPPGPSGGFTVSASGTNITLSTKTTLMLNGTTCSAYSASHPSAWKEFEVVVIQPAPIAAPAGWEFSPGQKGKPAILLVHGLAASSLHFTDPARAWNVQKTRFDHDQPMGSPTGTSDLPKVGLLTVEGSQPDPQATADGSMWAYLVGQGFTVATWDQTPCVEATAIPNGSCLDTDTFDRAYASAPKALAKLASMTSEDIVLVGHSRGGLVVRRLLKDPAVASVRGRIKTAITIHTPHQGTSIAGKGVELQHLFSTIQSKATGLVPSEVADAVSPRLSTLLGTPNAIVEQLVTTVGLAGARELSPGGSIYTALQAGETKPAGVRFYTFGGTSVNLWRLHAWVFTAASAVPANGYRADPVRLLSLPDDFPAAFDELVPGKGDLLVTDTSSRVPWEDGHFTNPLNHGEVLWSHAVHRKVHELVLGITLPPEPATSRTYTPVVRGSAADVLAAVKRLPVFSQLAGTVQAIASGDGFRFDASVSGVTLEAFAGPGAWHVAAGFDNPSLFTMGDQLREHLGAVTVDSVAVVVSPSAEAVPVAALPASIKARVAGWTGGGALELRAGVNVFAVVRASDDGLVGVLKSGLGLGTGTFRLSGTFGPDLLYRSLQAAGLPLTGAEPAATTEMHLALSLPRLTPPPFNATGKKDVMHLELDDVVLTVDRVGGAITIGGAVTGHAWVLGTELAIPGVRVAYSRPAGSPATITVEGSIAADLDPFGIGVPLRSLGVKGSFTTGAGGAKSLGISAGVAVKGKVIDGVFAIATTGATIDDISLTVSDLPLADLGLSSVPVLKDITITGAALGLRPSTKEAYVAGGVEWPGRLSTRGVLYVRRRPGSTGFALFAQTRDLDLKTLLALPAPVPSIPLPDVTVVASTIPLTSVPLTDLPPAAADMVAAVAAGGRVTFAQGLALVGQIDFAQGPFAVLGPKLGVSGKLTVTGSVSGLTTGKPTFSLDVAAPTFALPSPLSKLVLSVTPRLFLGLTQNDTGPEVAVGLAGDFKLNPEPFGGADLTVRGKTYVVVGATGAGAKLTGQLIGAWKDPFGITGIQIGEAATPATVSFGVTASLRFDVGLGGVVIFKPDSPRPLRFKAEGVMNAQVTPAFGIPVVTGIGINLEASELGPLTPLEIGQTLLASVASRAKAAGLRVSGVGGKMLDDAATFDLVSKVEQAIPLADVKLRGVELFLCTPGVTHPDFPGFRGFGVKAKGTLSYGATDLAGFDGEVNVEGFRIKTSAPRDLAFGPLTIKGAMLDIVASTRALPSFQLNGSVGLFGATAAVAVKVGLTEIATSFKLTLGKLDVVDVSLKSVGGSIPTDLKLTVVVDVQKLVDDVAAGVKVLLDIGPGKVLRDGRAAADAEVAAKQRAYDAAVDTALAERKALMKDVDRAKKYVDELTTRSENLDDRKRTAEQKLDAAWRALDVEGIATYSGQLIAIESERLSLDGFIETAKAALSVAESKAPTWFPVRLHPLVIAAQADLDAAKVAREVVLAGIDGLALVERAVTALQAAATSVNPLKSFKLVDASLKETLAGKPQQFEVKLVLDGKDVVVRPAYDLRNPSTITLDPVNQSVFAGTGGVPDQAAIDARLAKIALGFGDLRFFKDLKRDGTNTGAGDWIMNQKIGAPGFGELAFVTGGSGGTIYGLTWEKKLIKMKDTRRDGTAGWTGPEVLHDLDWTVREVFGGWNDHVGVTQTGRLDWKLEGPMSQVYNYMDFDKASATDPMGPRHRGRWARLFGGHDHVTYAIDWSGDLYCMKWRIDPATGKPINPDLEGGNRPTLKKLGGGWGRYVHVFGGASGTIYAVDAAGTMTYHKHAFHADCGNGTGLWGPRTGTTIGGGFGDFKQLFGGEDGVIYGVPFRPVDVTPGIEISLFSPANQRFLRANKDFADGSDIQRTSGLRPPNWNWETWKVVAGSDGRFALWSAAHKKFLRMNDKGQIDLSGTRTDGTLPADWKWEQFKLEPVGPGRYRLYSEAHKKYVGLDDTTAKSYAAGVAAGELNGYTRDVFEVVPLR